MSSHGFRLASAVVVIAALSCSREQTARPTSGALDLGIAVQSITPENLARHIERLSSDEFEGRAPGTEGEKLTVRYLTEQFKARGLKPGNPGGSYTQDVPLVGLIANASLRVVSGATTLNLRFPDDYVALTRRIVPQVTVAESDVVFVGYGVVAPEYGWDDYKGTDVRGKTIVMLVNDPAVPAAADPSTLDEHMFKGRAMTYYGRWTYKYEIAAQKGAAAAIIVPRPDQLGIPTRSCRQPGAARISRSRTRIET